MKYEFFKKWMGLEIKYEDGRKGGGGGAKVIVLGVTVVCWANGWALRPQKAEIKIDVTWKTWVHVKKNATF